MSKRDKIIILIIALLAIIPIIINEINIRPKLNLINDVNEILDNISSYERSSDEAEEFIINNSYKIDGEIYEVEGTGVIFIDEDNSVFLNRDGMCAMKLPYSDKVMIQYETCPVYRMLNGIKTSIATTSSGLYEIDNQFIYKGNNLENYVIYDNIIWNIISFENNQIKLIKTSSDTISYNTVEDIYNILQSNYSDLLDNNLVVDTKYNIELLNIENNKLSINNKEVISKIGLLTLQEYIDSSLNDYIISDNKISLKDRTFLSKEMLLSSYDYYLNDKYEVVSSSDIKEAKVYPVIVLSNSSYVTGGTGTKEDPYVIKET